MPHVSVVIPTFNRAHLVGRAIRSVLAQTFQDFEIVVVDDASTDSTREVLQAIEEPRLTYICNESNRGLAGARNVGVRASNGRYVSFLDDDDEWLPKKLQYQVNAVNRNPRVSLVYAGWEWISEEAGRVLRRRVPDERGLIDRLPRWAFNVAVDYLAYRETLQDNPYDEGLRYYPEFDLLLRLAMQNRFICIPLVLVRCHSHGGPRVSDGAEHCKAREMEHILQKYGSFISQDRRAWARFNLIQGALYLRHLGYPHSARRHLKRVVTARPLYWKGWAYFVASLMPPELLRFVRK